MPFVPKCSKCGKPAWGLDESGDFGEWYCDERCWRENLGEYGPWNYRPELESRDDAKDFIDAIDSVKDVKP
jgi:hypothetical protein